MIFLFKKHPGLTFLFVAVTLYVNPNAAQDIKVKHENGVEVVYNPRDPCPLPGTPTQLVLTEELVIRDMDAGGNQIFTSPGSIKADDQGNIYILDVKLSHIRVVDPQGKLIRTIGKKGQGPGELGLPRWMEMTTNKDIMVYDVGNRKVTHYSLQGEVVKEYSIAEHGFIIRIRPDSLGNYIVGVSVPDPEYSIYEIKKFNTNFSPVCDLCSVRFKRPGQDVFEPLRGSTLRFYLTLDDNIMWGDGETYELRVIDQTGKLLRKIIKDYEPRKVTKEEKEKLTEELKGITDRGLTLKLAKHYPPYQHFYIDAEGRIYVRTWKPTEDEKGWFYDFFDADGRYIAHQALSVSPWFFTKDKVYTMDTDEDGFPIVRRFRLEWQ
jgi:hypothetical protein